MFCNTSEAGFLSLMQVLEGLDGNIDLPNASKTWLAMVMVMVMVRCNSKDAVDCSDGEFASGHRHGNGLG